MHNPQQEPTREQLVAAIQQLHKAKGRYHTQHAVCKLFDLVGLPNVKPGQEQVETLSVETARPTQDSNAAPQANHPSTPFQGVGWHPVNGELHGYAGTIVLRHLNGEFRIGHSNWVSKKLVRPYSTTGTAPLVEAYRDTLQQLGYVEWAALDTTQPERA